MKTLLSFAALLLTLSATATGQNAAFASTATAQVANDGRAHVVKYSSTATNLAAGKLPRTVGMTFSIYEDASGAPIWTEVQNVVVDRSANFTVLLGAATAEGLPREIFEGRRARWLAYRIEGGAESERELFVSVPYALKSADADTLGGQPVENFVGRNELAAATREIVAQETARFVTTDSQQEITGQKQIADEWTFDERATFKGGIDTQSMNTVLSADSFEGTDWCQKVNAANAALGTGAGEIWVSRKANPAACSVSIVLTEGHVLRFVQGGTYVLGNQAILLDSAARLIGTGASTVLSVLGGGIRPLNVNTRTRKIVLADFTLLGTGGKSGGVGLDLVNVQNALVQNVTVDMFRVPAGTGVGVRILASGNYNANYNRFYNVTIANSDTALLMDAVGTANIAGYNEFHGLTVEGQVHGVILARSNVHGAGYNRFYSLHIQGGSGRLLRVAGGNNSIFGLSYEGGMNPPIWLERTSGGTILQGVISASQVLDEAGANHVMIPGYNRWSANGTHFYSNSGLEKPFDLTYSAGNNTTQPIEFHLNNNRGRRWNYGMSTHEDFFVTRQGGLARLQLATQASRLNAESAAAVEINATANAGSGGLKVFSGGSSPQEVATIDGTGKAKVKSIAVGSAGLDADGKATVNALTIGQAGTPVSKLAKLDISLALGVIPARQCTEQRFRISGVSAADIVIGFNRTSFSAPFGLGGARVTAEGELAVVLCNSSDVQITPAPEVFRLVLLN